MGSHNINAKIRAKAKRGRGLEVAGASTEKIGFYGATPVVQPSGAAQAALTDSTGGTANDTLAAMPTLTDSPATADALRDDIVTNMVPVINSNFADLAAKYNALRSALVTLGLIKGSA